MLREIKRAETNKNRSVFSKRPPSHQSSLSDSTHPSIQAALPKRLRLNKRLKMDGLKFLSALPKETFPVCFFDPQYRGILDKMQYGNEGKTRGKARSGLEQMPEKTIAAFIVAIDLVLKPSGHLFLWIDKFHLCEGFHHWTDGTELVTVDLVVWDKGKIGMGYRTRRTSEYCVVLQKKPVRAKGIWHDHSIPDTVKETIPKKKHPHQKSLGLQGKLLSAVTRPHDIVLDPAAGSFSVMDAAGTCDRNFLGCDING